LLFLAELDRFSDRSRPSVLSCIQGQEHKQLFLDFVLPLYLNDRHEDLIQLPM